MRVHLELEVALQRLLDALPDQQLVEVLQIGKPFEKQYPLDQPVGVLHLVDRLVVLVLGEPLQAPVLEHARVQEVLVDRRELVREDLVQVLDDLLVAFHARLLVRDDREYHARASKRGAWSGGAEARLRVRLRLRIRPLAAEAAPCPWLRTALPARSWRTCRNRSRHQARGADP